MKKTKKEGVAEYVVQIKVLGKTYTAKGKSVKEALAKLNPGNCRGRGILIVSHGKATKERILSPLHTARLFNTAGLSKEVMVTCVSSLFQGI